MQQQAITCNIFATSCYVSAYAKFTQNNKRKCEIAVSSDVNILQICLIDNNNWNGKQCIFGVCIELLHMMYRAYQMTRVSITGDIFGINRAAFVNKGSKWACLMNLWTTMRKTFYGQGSTKERKFARWSMVLQGAYFKQSFGAQDTWVNYSLTSFTLFSKFNSAKSLNNKIGIKQL